ncbi:hypothetical protein [Mycobacterium sp. 050134]|uniref:hypothetical protein n=1 Tax=Mycobacterium sp. 050134 TaxID=3096111 RepID=UPI002ED9F33C
MKSDPVSEDDIPTSAADLRALAEQAEAEAAEAEALAAAARARAIQLRRRAELAEASQEVPEASAAAEPDAEAPAADEERAADVVDTPEPEKTPPAAAPEPRPRRFAGRLRRPRWSTVGAAVAVLVIVAALAGSGYMIKRHEDAVRQHQRVAEFAAAARQGVVTLTSLDFNNAKQGVQRILENSTGTFKDDFLKMADDFTKVVEQSKVVSQGSVQATAVDLDTMTNDSAVVLVASTSEVTNAAGAKQDPRNYRLIVTVARDGGQLKIAKVEFVP